MDTPAEAIEILRRFDAMLAVPHLPPEELVALMMDTLDALEQLEGPEIVQAVIHEWIGPEENRPPATGR